MIELVVSDILSKASDDRAYVMILRERDGLRKILIAIGFAEAQAIAFAMKGIDTKRPITHDLFKNLCKISDGTFYSNMLFRKENEELCEVDARTSDAVAIALRLAAPIYIDEELLDRVAIRDEWGGAISVPITIADTETLRSVMDKAIKEENYELAMKIKEEIDSRLSNKEDVEQTDENEN